MGESDKGVMDTIREKRAKSSFKDTATDLIACMMNNGMYVATLNDKMYLTVDNVHMQDFLASFIGCNSISEVEDVVEQYDKKLCRHNGKIMTLKEKDEKEENMKIGLRALGSL